MKSKYVDKIELKHIKYPFNSNDIYQITAT